MFDLFKKEIKAQEIVFEVITLLDDQISYLTTPIVIILGIKRSTTYENDSTLITKPEFMIELALALLIRENLCIKQGNHEIIS
jgi:hypothetical protein